jgi:hypothetical protein
LLGVEPSVSVLALGLLENVGGELRYGVKHVVREGNRQRCFARVGLGAVRRALQSDRPCKK